MIPSAITQRTGTSMKLSKYALNREAINRESYVGALMSSFKIGRQCLLFIGKKSRLTYDKSHVYFSACSASAKAPANPALSPSFGGTM